MEDPEKNIALVAILPLRLAEKTFLVNILATAQAKDKSKFSAMLFTTFSNHIHAFRQTTKGGDRGVGGVTSEEDIVDQALDRFKVYWIVKVVTYFVVLHFCRPTSCSNNLSWRQLWTVFLFMSRSILLVGSSSICNCLFITLSRCCT